MDKVQAPTDTSLAVLAELLVALLEVAAEVDFSVSPFTLLTISEPEVADALLPLEMAPIFAATAAANS